MTEPLYSITYSHPSEKQDTFLRRFIRHFDWLLLISVLLLTLLGFVIIYSAASRFGNPELFLGKQLAAFGIGIFFLFVLSTINYQIWSEHPRIIFMVSIFLLILVLMAGKTSHGAKAWLSFYTFSFQPAEISKIFTILVLAAWCDQYHREIQQLKILCGAVAIVLAHVGLILLQPDLGSTLVYFPILLSMLFVAGAPLGILFAIFLFGFLSFALVLLHTYLSLSPNFLKDHAFWHYIYAGMSLGREFIVLQLVIGSLFALVWWFTKQMRFRIPGIYFILAYLLALLSCSFSGVLVEVLKDYQRKRLMVFFNPRIDPAGSGYHVIQSVIALGSGKIFGKGLFSGTQGRLGFVPEQHTDFIFSVLGEELGFMISGLVLLLYLVLIWRSVSIANEARDRFGSLVAMGIGSMFAFYAILNLSMVMGMAPVTGLPLPFLSYGGSALFSSLFAVGILLSIHMRRYIY